MFINHNEYQMMFDAEEKLWWYRFLHHKVLKTIEEAHGKNKDITILDAGCGTGGLMTFLTRKGYTNLVGFDYSVSAVQFSQERGLPVLQLSIDDIYTQFSDKKFDIIVCDDVICTLTVQQIRDAFKNIDKLLKPTGQFISNNNAFAIFRGTHDIAVGSKHRFTLKSLRQYYEPTRLEVARATYWSIFLSPLILTVRLFQQLKIKLGLVDESKLVSDVSVPPPVVNQALYRLVRLEEKIVRKSPFGSSLFTVFKKRVS